MTGFRDSELGMPTFKERQAAYRLGWNDHDQGYPKNNTYRSDLLVIAYNRGYSDAQQGIYDDNNLNSYIG